MIEIKADEMALQKISQEIGNLPYKAPTILKDVANATGKKALEQLRTEIRRQYVFKDSAINLQESLRRKSASYANPRTIIDASGSMTSLSDYYVTPRRLSRGANRVGPYASHVLRSSAPDTLNERTFMVKFKSGHIAVVERIPGKRYSDANAQKRIAAHLNTSKIEEKRSPSVAHMANRSFREIEEDVSIQLQNNMKKYIDRFMKRSKA